MKDYPLIRICLLYMSGIILQKVFAIDITVLFILSLSLIVFSLFLIIFRRSPKSAYSFCLFPLVVLAGAVSYNIYNMELKPYPYRLAKLKEALVYGKVRTADLKRDFEFKFLLDTDSIRYNGKTENIRLSVICRVRDTDRQKMDSSYQDLKTGQYLALKGTLSRGRERRNPGEFDYHKYLEERGISAIHTVYNANDLKILRQPEGKTMEEYVFNIRKNIDDLFYKYHTVNCASLLRGFLLADRSEVDEDVQTDFINTGVVHILAVSGSNVFLIILLFMLVFGRFNVIVRSCITLTGLFLFLLITGTSPSVVRAVVMGAVAIVVFLTNRSYNVYNLLAIAALIILSAAPEQLFDPGFQLSFAAVLSIVVIYPHLKSLIDRLNITSKALYKTLLFISVTIAAETGVLPFTLYYFGKVSIVSLPANLLVIPASGLISAVGIGTLIISYISPWLAEVFAAANNVFAGLLVGVTHALGNLRLSYLSIRQFSLSDLVIFYTFLCGYFIIIRYLASLKAKAVAALLVIFNVTLFCSLDNKKLLPDNELGILSIDVGQGDATLIKFPNNMTALIDAGGAANYFDSGEKIILPLLNYLGIDKIDYAFISHVDSDHYSGFISLVEKGIIKKVFKPPLDRSYPKDIRLEEFLRGNRVPLLYYRRGSLKFGNVMLYILNRSSGKNPVTADLNDRSGIIKIVYGKTSFMFEGDAGKIQEGLLVGEYGKFLRAEVLKLGHHGSKNSSSEAFLRNVRPEFGIISAGVQNRFGHPSREVLQRSGALNIRLLRTDLEGAILLSSNGESIRKVNWKF